MKHLWTIAAIAALAVAAAAVVWTFWPRDSVSKAAVSDAVVDFRQEMKRNRRFARRQTGPIPPFGVYRYRTRGRESIDTTALGTGHDYNGVSTVTLTPSRCGLIERWQVLVERWTEAELCLEPETSRVAEVTDFHEFFGQSRSTPFSCRGGVSPYTPDLRAGMSWRTACGSKDGSVTNEVEVVGMETVRVAGRKIPAVHVRSDSILEGDPDGAAKRESWLRRSDGLLLRRTASSDAHVDTAGGGQFRERYELELISTRPQR